MSHLRSLWRELWAEEGGLTTVEYAILLSLISLAAMGGYGELGCRVRSTVRAANRALRIP